jgi:hypothetical protein
MELYINSEKMDFELENEKNSFDVVNSLSELFSKTEPKQFITKISIDEKEYSFADEEKLKSVNIDNVKKIEVEVNDLFGITTLSFEQIGGFLELLSEVFKNKKRDENSKNINEYVLWMKQGISQIIKLFYGKENQFKEEKSFYENCDGLIKILSSGNSFESISEEAALVIEMLKGDLKDIKNMLIHNFKLPDRDYIIENINVVVKNIDEILPKLESIPILFQNGEDRESMNIIQNLTEILEKSINLFLLFKETFKLHMDKYTVKEVSFEEFFNIVTDHLKQLMDAIQNKDSVMIGDLLEYEFVPNLNEVKSILTKVYEEAFVKVN